MLSYSLFYEFVDKEKQLAEQKHPKNVKLQEVFSTFDSIYFGYDHDYGNGSKWVHKITMEKIIYAQPNKKYPVCVDGEFHTAIRMADDAQKK